MIRKLDFLIIKNGGSGISHDTRKDIKTLSMAINQLIQKTNELVFVVNKQEEIIKTYTEGLSYENKSFINR